ncbi:MAG TPA: DUF4169 family protein [Stellaceae bacterium]|jgi:hypothetical protein|nr:DUF4169 family protein [Stellaceae bacterium]
MAEIVNLNRFRKARERDGKAKLAETNRARFGRSKDDKAKSRSETERAEKSLDDKKLD